MTASTVKGCYRDTCVFKICFCRLSIHIVVPTCLRMPLQSPSCRAPVKISSHVQELLIDGKGSWEGDRRSYAQGFGL